MSFASSAERRGTGLDQVWWRCASRKRHEVADRGEARFLHPIHMDSQSSRFNGADLPLCPGGPRVPIPSCATPSVSSGELSIWQHFRPTLDRFDVLEIIGCP